MKWVAVLGVLLLAACATPSVDDFKQQMIPNSQIQIQDRFDTREINVESYAAEVVRCFPEVKIDASRTESIQKALDNA
ncbi:MAG: hypothetical protein HC765_01930 [Brachymonas sp.]|nr:hypothetical protein [Brachymonas sp.]